MARLAVRGPAGEAFDVPVEDAQRRVMLPPFERSGVWTVQGAVPEEAVVPVSQLFCTALLKLCELNAMAVSPEPEPRSSTV